MNILKYISSFFKTGPERTFGALRNPVDVRDINVAEFQKPQEIPLKFITDISKLPVMNQMGNGSCVGQAEGTAVEYFETKELGIPSDISRRYLYAMCKKVDGYDGQGTYPRVASKVLTDKGCATTLTVPNSDFLAHQEYINVVDSESIEDDAHPRRVGGYASVNPTAEALKQAIYKNGVVTITLAVDPDAWGEQFGKLRKPKKTVASHRIMLYGYETTVMYTRFYFRNSWGESWGDKGNGSFIFNDYEGYIYDATTYADIPNKLLKRVKEEPYFFTQTLKLGSSGYEVTKLQERLNVVQKPTGYFGPLTDLAVREFQLKNKLKADGIVGAQVRAILNKGMTPSKAKLLDFCEAIKSFEGYYPGSLSYKNNNPGNLRSWKTQVGTYKGFAVFKSYEDGFKALQDLIIMAKTGKSRYYKPDMSFFEFFSVYAPGSDGNNPKRYAEYVAQKLKVDITYKIKDLI